MLEHREQELALVQVRQDWEQLRQVEADGYIAVGHEDRQKPLYI